MKIACFGASVTAQGNGYVDYLSKKFDCDVWICSSAFMWY